MKSKTSYPMPSYYDIKGLRETKFWVVSLEQEHEWRELLQKQLADHWLKLNYPEEIRHKNVILEKSAVQERESSKKIVIVCGSCPVRLTSELMALQLNHLRIMNDQTAHGDTPHARSKG